MLFHPFDHPHCVAESCHEDVCATEPKMLIPNFDSGCTCRAAQRMSPTARRYPAARTKIDSAGSTTMSFDTFDFGLNGSLTGFVGNLSLKARGLHSTNVSAHPQC